MSHENKVKQIALRIDRELIRKIVEIDEYLKEQSLYVRRSLSATVRFCVENQWLSMASIFAERRATNEPPKQEVVAKDQVKRAKLKTTSVKTNKTSDNKPARPRRTKRSGSNHS